MLRSVYLKTLREMRWGVLGWGTGIGLLVLASGFGWAKAYPDETSRRLLAAQLHGGLSVAQSIYGPARNADTLGGFIEWRALGLAPVLLGLYLILAGTGLTRGSEESKTIEAVVATPRTRARVLGEQAAGLATGLLIASVLMWALCLPVGLLSGEPSPSLIAEAEAFANVAAGALLFGAIGLLAAQLFLRRRTAALAATGLMATLYLMNTLPLAVPGIRGLRRASPLYLYTSSAPLAGDGMNWAAFGTLLALTAATMLLALFALGRRDLLDTWHPWRRSARPETARRSTVRKRGGRQLFLRNSLGRGYRDAMGSTLGWAAGLSALTVLFAALTPNMRQAMLEQSGGTAARLIGTTEKGIFSSVISFLVPPLVAVFGVTLAASWAGDEISEHLELELVAPVPRWKVFLERLAAAIASIATALTVVTVAIITTIVIGSADVPLRGVAEASGTMLVLTACVVAFGFAVASWRPGSVTAVAGGFVAISYFANLILPLFDLPHWVRYVTIFGLYGSPLADGVAPWRLAVFIAAGVALAAAGCAGFQRKDIAR